MDHVDSKFIGLISPKLQKFKRVKPDLYNFRCPICGDSKKNKSKTRGYLYAVKTNVNFKCHNCGASMSLNNFLKTVDPYVHKQYTFEKFKDGHTGRNFVAEEPKFKFEPPKFKPKLDLSKASENQIAKQYLEKRNINPSKFYYTDTFKEWLEAHNEKDIDKVLSYETDDVILDLPDGTVVEGKDAHRQGLENYFSMDPELNLFWAMPYVGVINGEAWIIAGSVENLTTEEGQQSRLLMVDAQFTEDKISRLIFYEKARPSQD